MRVEGGNCKGWQLGKPLMHACKIKIHISNCQRKYVAGEKHFKGRSSEQFLAQLACVHLISVTLQTPPTTLQGRGGIVVAGCSEDPPTRRKGVSVPMPGNINLLQSLLLLFCAHQAAGTLCHLKISESLHCSSGSAVQRMGFILRGAQPALPRDSWLPDRAMQAHAAQ